jgi:hypothetical protein
VNSSDFISVDEVVSEAASFLRDEEFTHGLGKTFYEMLAHRAIEDLALNTFFQTVTKDIYDWNACGTLIISTPKNLFNIKGLFLFNSSCDKKRCGTDNDQCADSSTDNCNQNANCGDDVGECCKSKSCWTEFQEAHWKRNFNRFGSTGVKTAKIAPGHYDKVYLTERGAPSGLIYFGMQNGEMCFSDNANCYKNLRIIANGFGTDNDKLPIIPRELRRVIVDTIKYKGCIAIMPTHPEYGNMYKVYYNELYGDGSIQNPGSYLAARRFIISMNSKQRNDLFEYFGNIEIK